ncbi:hypothetical protein QCA50_015585 [Cerrena zonata]|uniref:Uncharacterized protein n=1 Tax=Cerrena zonata TaxID=2478898 RepID=A0AAW0FK64_9APHY
MATLTRPRTLDADVSDISHVLTRGVPKPFPTLAEREQEELLESLESEQLRLDIDSAIPGPSTTIPAYTEASRVGGRSDELPPSINNLRTLCLTTLNDLLTATRSWQPIVPDRRHSMPSPSTSTASLSHTTALQTLVSNLRSEEHDGQISQPCNSTDDALLLRELQDRVARLAVGLDSQHSQLAGSLVSLLTHFHRLFELYPPSAPSTSPRVSSWSSSNKVARIPSPEDAFTDLRRQLSDFQLERSVLDGRQQPARSPVRAVETALLWSRIDDDLEMLSTLCRSTTDDSHLPPEYDPADYEHDVDYDHLPQYEYESKDFVFEKEASRSSVAPKDTDSIITNNVGGSGSSAMSEKMKMDLEAVTMAIDRLYMVAPQLHSQRVELKKTKVEQMERAKRLGKQKATDVDDVNTDLERMVALIGKASGRKMNDQSAEISSSLKAKLEQAKQQDVEKRKAFVEQLMVHAGAGRLQSQDATYHPPLERSHTEQPSDRMHDPNALLTLPEFMREAVPEPIQRRMRLEERDPEALLSLPEFVREPIPERLLHPPKHSRGKSYSLSREQDDTFDISAPKPLKASKKNRSRSLSAPPLAWLLSSSSRTSPVPHSNEQKKSRSARNSRPGSRPGSSHGRIEPVQEHLDVSYVAEHHENLQHILVFLTIRGLKLGSHVNAEVVSNDGGTKGKQLLLECDSGTSPMLCLPVRVPIGKKEVKPIPGTGDRFEIKLPTSSPSSRSRHNTPSPIPEINENEAADVAILDATQLSSLTPTSFICASCSLPLVHASRLHQYRDLPSEHWAELVDAWMCHADLKLSEDVKKGSKDGFWPEAGEGLVGGSYVLVHEDAVITTNFCDTEAEVEKYSDDWHRVRCICGAVVGRSREHTPTGGEPCTIYRLAKYAFRPVSPMSEPLKLPLSAFIVEDMNEFVQAHATYRFVVVDEEDDRPRILIWLFKPNMRLSYTTPSQFLIPKNGSIRGAKVLFKLLVPSTTTELHTILNKYPGFPQAEHLYYPIDICRRLAGLLKESNTAYPEHMKTMTGLDVGWLQRA